MILFAFLIRVTLGVLFVRAGALKAANTVEFRQAISNYALLPQRAVPAAALGVTAAELIVGLVLLLGIEPRWTGSATATLLIVFCVAVAINLLRGRTIACGCSGTVASDISWGHVIGNCTLAAAAVAVAVWAAEPLSVLPGIRDAHQSLAWTSRAIAGVLIMTSIGVLVVLTSEARRALVVSGAIRAKSEDGAG